MTTFPTNGDYVQALQHTNLCFDDPDLKAGRIELTRLGMPKAISGNFASVFSITGGSGKRYAVKCFTRDVNGQHHRYRAIHDVLAGLARPWQVGFEYVERGVLVEGQWHAILRMEWVAESQTLIPWLERNLGNPDRILHVANQFAACIEDMSRAGIAHGDLQHGNLLIDTNDTLRVIDYDGMFVPSIKDLEANELGLANYQHPRRSSSDFAPYLDRFGAWLIYGSLISLAAHPGLWSTLRKQGDEKLLFGKDDFVPPLDAIERIKLLGSPHTEVADLLTESLTSSRSLASVPEFDPGRIPRPTQSQVRTQAPAAAAWWRQPGDPAADTTTAADGSVPIVRLGSGWLRSHEGPLPPVDVVGVSNAKKMLVLGTTAATVLGAVALGISSHVLLGGLIVLAWAAVLAIGTWWAWRRSDAVVGRSAARRQSKLASREVTQQQKLVAKAQSARADLNGSERRALQDLEGERSKLPKSSAAEYERETKKLRKHVTTLQTALDRLDTAKAAEARQQLKMLQEKHIQTYMAARRIEAGVIPGIGEALSAALRVHGLRTAADIAAVSGTRFRATGSNNWFTIHGIGPSKSFDIQYWHQRQLALASDGAPPSLPAQLLQVLDDKFAAQKRQLQADIDFVAPQLRQIKATVDAKYAALNQEITLKGDAVRIDYQRQRSAGDATVAQTVVQQQLCEDALLNAQRELARYERVSLSRYLRA